MVDTSVARVALGATTLNRKWFLDVNTGTDAVPVWVGVFGIQDFKPTTDNSEGDTSDFTSGWKGTQKTALGWANEVKLKRASTAASATAYDPGQEALRTKGGQLGVAGRVSCRWYEMDPGGPRVEAYQGWGSVEWSDDGGGMDALSTVTCKIVGDGARNSVTHPTLG
ncbi:phage tail tube protein [Tessaracoccus sp.]